MPCHQDNRKQIMKKTLTALLLGIIFLTGCNTHFISDSSYRQQVAEDLATRQEIMQAAGIDLDAMGLECDEREALEFLYAYMPLGDMLNKTPEYYLDHYQMTRRALDEMPWGAKVPEREIRTKVFPKTV